MLQVFLKCSFSAGKQPSDFLNLTFQTVIDMFTNAEEETTVQESTELTTEQRRWAGTESPARSVCLGLKVPSKLNWVPGTRPSFLFLSPAPVYFHYQYQILIAGPCGISLQGIASQRDPISPHPWSPPSYRVTVSWLQSAALISFLSGFSGGVGTRGGRAPGKDWSSLFSAGGRKGGRRGFNSLAWEHLMFQRSVNRATSPQRRRCGCPSVREDEKLRRTSGGRRCSARSVLTENMKKSIL